MEFREICKADDAALAGIIRIAAAAREESGQHYETEQERSEFPGVHDFPPILDSEILYHSRADNARL